jgi:hypothetical protein
LGGIEGRGGVTGDYVLGILGIVVSVVLFVIGYRQTVGAKKERLITANAEIEKILVRRVVLESYVPKTADIVRLIEGKARDFRVVPADMLAPEQVLNTLFARIVESDLIPQDRREEIIKRITPALTEAESEPIAEQAVAAFQTRARRVGIWSAGVALGIGASILGSFVSIAPGITVLETAPRELITMLLATLGISLVLIFALIAFARVKESQEAPSQVDSLAQYVYLERDVAKVLERAGAKFAGTTKDAGYDFLAERAGKKFLIEVKNWTRPVPSAILRAVAQRLNAALDREQAHTGIIVTSAPLPSAGRLPDDSRVRVMSLRELRNFLVHQS